MESAFCKEWRKISNWEEESLKDDERSLVRDRELEKEDVKSKEKCTIREKESLLEKVKIGVLNWGGIW